MLNRIKQIAKGLFAERPGEKNIFGHEANDEPCAVCQKPMRTEQDIIRVRSGEKMHSKCWPTFMEMTIDRLKNKCSTHREYDND